MIFLKGTGEPNRQQQKNACIYNFNSSGSFFFSFVWVQKLLSDSGLSLFVVSILFLGLHSIKHWEALVQMVNRSIASRCWYVLWWACKLICWCTNNVSLIQFSPKLISWCLLGIKMDSCIHNWKREIMFMHRYHMWSVTLFRGRVLLRNNKSKLSNFSD